MDQDCFRRRINFYRSSGSRDTHTVSIGSPQQFWKSLTLCALAVGLIIAISGTVSASPINDDQSVASSRPTLSEAIRRTEQILKEVRARSFPELSKVDIQVRTFSSKSDFFRTRFSLSRYFLLRRMQYYIEVNPRVFATGVPETGVRAILAHELEHVLYISGRSRISNLSLVRLASSNYTTRFERRADLGAVGKGYASGLVDYRIWLYAHIPAASVAEKRRDYFSPEELSAIESILKTRPGMLKQWMNKVPLNLSDINPSAQR